MESTSSREHPSSDHTLRVLVRIDTQRREACLEVRGCLTSATCSTLMNILAHTGSLGAAVRVNLLRAVHVERDALELLRSGAASAVETGAGASPAALDRRRPVPPGAPSGTEGAAPGAEPVEILAPPDFPVCRLGPVSPAVSTLRGAEGHPLTNDEAVEMAFLRRDPRVLAAERPPGPQTLRPGGRNLQA